MNLTEFLSPKVASSGHATLALSPQTATLLASLGLTRGKSRDDFNFEGGLHCALQNETPSHHNTFHQKRYVNPLRNSYLQEALLSLLWKQIIEQVKVHSSGFLQLPLLGSNIKHK